MHNGKIFVHVNDVQGAVDAARMEGSRVSFQVYADGSGLGAQQCKVTSAGAGVHSQPQVHAPWVPKGVKRTISKRPTLGRFASRTAVAKVRSKGTAAGQTAGRAARAPGVHSAGAGRGTPKGAKQQPPRTRLPGGRAKGEVLSWKGNFGWIKPSMPIKHQSAGKHSGKVFVHLEDMEDGSKPSVGDTVDFFAYADSSGLGAEECRVIASEHAVKAELAEPEEPEFVDLDAAEEEAKAAKEAAEVRAGKGKGKGAAGSKGPPVLKSVAKAAPAKVLQSKPKASSLAGKGGMGKSGSAENDVLPSKPKAFNKGGKPMKGYGKGKEVAATIAPVDTTGDEAAAEAVLPPNWEEHWSEEHGVPYFWNRATKESRWLRP